MVVFEKQDLPCDKACGEGIMPAGVRVLDTLGVRELLGEAHRLTAVRYVQEDGSFAESRLPGPGGLGVRRTLLSEAMVKRARAAGAVLRPRVGVREVGWSPDRAILQTDEGPVAARVVVAADGLKSTLRRTSGLAARRTGPLRFGLRRHFRLLPWSSAVEVHFSRGIEAYVTPVGAGRVGVALLWEAGQVPRPATFNTLLAPFGVLRERLAGVPCDSAVRGAGPFLQATRARCAHRLVLLGDAAGYVDPVTGEGLSLALVGARALAELLPDALSRGSGRGEFLAYERAAGESFLRYALVAQSVLALARRPRLRRPLVRLLGSCPGLFERIVAAAVG